MGKRKVHVSRRRKAERRGDFAVHGAVVAALLFVIWIGWGH